MYDPLFVLVHVKRQYKQLKNLDNSELFDGSELVQNYLLTVRSHGL